MHAFCHIALTMRRLKRHHRMKNYSGSGEKLPRVGRKVALGRTQSYKFSLNLYKLKLEIYNLNLQLYISNLKL